MGNKSSVPRRQPWEGLSEHWNLLGPPLRPSRQDMERLRAAWIASLPAGIPERRIDILLLGVTPEVARFTWSPRSFLTALDFSTPMLQAVWPGDSPARRAVQGEWLQTPFAAASFDLVMTDAGLVALGGLDRIAALSREIRRILRSDGRAVVRQFARPVPAESPEALVQAVASGEIRDFNVLKLRLLMALPCDRADSAVSLPSALAAFEEMFPDRAALARQLGCSLATVSTIDAYRGRDAGYVFATEEELAQCCPEFSIARGPEGDYPLANCCPVFSFTPRA